MIRITIDKIETVWEKSRKWERLHDDPMQPNQYGYVDGELPTTQSTRLLEQYVEELDLPQVIKAINKL